MWPVFKGAGNKNKKNDKYQDGLLPSINVAHRFKVVNV